MRAVVTSVIVYVVGVALAFVAAVTGSVGPEPPRTELGKVLAIVYRPYYEPFFVFDALGFLIALALSGLPLMLLVLGVFWMRERMRRP
jgi:hypothetical protein